MPGTNSSTRPIGEEFTATVCCVVEFGGSSSPVIVVFVFVAVIVVTIVLVVIVVVVVVVVVGCGIGVVVLVRFESKHSFSK